MKLDHHHFLARAIELACQNVEKQRGGPFSCVIVKNGKIIAEGTNRVTTTNDPTAHAEIVAIRRACKKLGTFQLKGCTLYASCEPCPMCLGAIYWARPQEIIFAAAKTDAARVGFDDQFIYAEILKPLARRKIKTRQLATEASTAPFYIWERSSTKIRY